MDGRRFGVGLALGLLLGFGVIASVGFVGLGNSGTSNADNAELTAARGASSTTQSATTTTTYGAAAAAGSPPSTESATSTSNSTPSTQPATTADLNTPPAPSNNYDLQKGSQLQNIPNQSQALTGLVLLPVLVALILGAAMYRVSSRRTEENGQPSAG